MRKLKNLTRRFLYLLRYPVLSRDLSDLLSSAPTTKGLDIQIQWLESLLHWIRRPAYLPNEIDDNSGALQSLRIRFLLQLLERRVEWKEKLASILQNILAHSNALELFCQTGLSRQSGLLRELIERAFELLLPSPPKHDSLAELFQRLFLFRQDADWVERIPDEAFTQIRQLFRSGDKHPKTIFKPIIQAVTDALFILGNQVASLGHSYELRKRRGDSVLSHSPWIHLNQFLQTHLLESPASSSKIPFEKFFNQIQKCRNDLSEILSTLERSGVSISVVYTIELLTHHLTRIEQLLTLLSDKKEDPAAIRAFVASLIREVADQKTFTQLIHNNLHLLSRKIVERAAKTGEHYSVRTKKEYHEMLRAGSGAGALTVGTTFMKFSISGFHLPLFFEGLFHSLNYAFSFVTLQFFHFSLATKQPAMTAPALAGKLAASETPDPKEFIDEVKKLTRCQFSALLGNVGMALPVSLTVAIAARFFDIPFIMSPDKALYTLKSINPLQSLTLILAAFTGVLLWLSSIIAGWVENWIVYHELPEGIAMHSTLHRLIGKKNSQRLGKWLLTTSGTLSGNISLGFLLGFCATVGHFFGLPLDVRHVTLSSCAYGFALPTLWGPEFPWILSALSLLGIGLMGALNFGVSFTLALAVAAKARSVTPGLTRRLMGEVWQHFRKHPMSFLFA